MRYPRYSTDIEIEELNCKLAESRLTTLRLLGIHQLPTGALTEREVQKVKAKVFPDRPNLDRHEIVAVDTPDGTKLTTLADLVDDFGEVRAKALFNQHLATVREWIAILKKNNIPHIFKHLKLVAPAAVVSVAKSEYEEDQAEDEALTKVYENGV